MRLQGTRVTALTKAQGSRIKGFGTPCSQSSGELVAAQVTTRLRRSFPPLGLDPRGLELDSQERRSPPCESPRATHIVSVRGSTAERPYITRWNWQSVIEQSWIEAQGEVAGRKARIGGGASLQVRRDRRTPIPSGAWGFLRYFPLRVISCGSCPTDWRTGPGLIGCFLFSHLRGEYLSEAW